MPIQFPNNRKQVEERARADVKSQLVTSNPWLKNSFLGALITGYAGRIYEFYLQLKNALLELFPDTASGSYLERWGSYVAITRNAATQTSGYVVFTGTNGTIIPASTPVSSSDSNLYSTSTSSTITTAITPVLSIVRSGSTAAVTTTSEHSLASGVTVTIAGADQTEYNGSYQILATGDKTFTYTVSGTPTTPATGTITSQNTSAYVFIQSVDYGSDQNQTSGTRLTLASAISGVDTTVYVTPDEIGGGSDIESDEDYRTRVLYRYQNPIALFNESSIKTEVFKRSGVTRAWVFGAGSSTDAQPVTSITRNGSVATVTTTDNHYLEDGQYITIDGASQSGYNKTSKIISISDTELAYVVDSSTVTPATGTISMVSSVPPGVVKIYFTRDDDISSIIPTASEVSAVETQVLTIKPAHVAPSDVIVRAPVSVPVNFTFTELTPNTSSMISAVTQSLETLFRYETNVSENLHFASYTAAIWQTVDNTGASVRSFTLSTPTTTQTINEGEIASLGTVTFS